MPAPSFAGRAMLALLLMVGFYLFAVTIAVALLAVPVLEVVYLHRIDVKILIACVSIGIMILASIVPRPMPFVPPGPELEPSAYPRLFETISDIASKTGQSMPTHVYLDTEVNAWVAERGGFLGFGTHRVMGLGLPLMQVISVEQFRAVLAHEFGHYAGGDTRLGVFIYNTRASIARTVQSLKGSAVNTMFIWYAHRFMRITHAISRRQELAADELAAKVAGPEALAGGLRATHGAGMMFSAFWKSEMVPVLEARLRAPVLRGFSSFLSSDAVTELTTRVYENPPEPDPDDTHPPLLERIRALGVTGDARDDAPLALTLLGSTEELEQEYLDLTFGPQSRSFAAVNWDDVGMEVYLPHYRRLIETQRDALAGRTPLDLPGIAKAPGQFQTLIKMTPGTRSESNVARMTNSIVGVALACALADRGWTLWTAPGHPIELRSGDDASTRLRPFDILRELADGTLSEAAWSERCAAWGIAPVNLAAAASEA